MDDREAFGSDEGWAGWIRPTLGFAGDIAADPLTYIGAATVRAGTSKAPATALDRALRGGSRTDLAGTVMTQAAKSGMVDDAVKRLATEAGQRGRGAFTRQGLQRAGVADDVVERLGLTSEFGYSVGGLRANSVRANIPGTRALAEASENMKGSIKKAFGSTNGARIFRNTFVGGRSAIGQAERKLTHQIITGAGSPAEAALGLAAIKQAKIAAHPWMDATLQGIKERFGKELQKLSDDEAKAITHAIEVGDFEGLAGKVAGWYKDVGDELRGLGADFGDVGENYVNHTMTDRALRALRSGDSRLKAAGLDADEAFQMTRTLKQGDEFLGETIPVIPGMPEGEFASIAQLNKISQDVLGYDVFESDIRHMMGTYIAQGQEARLRAAVADSLLNNGLGQLTPRGQIADLAMKEADALAEGVAQRKAAIDTVGEGLAAERQKVASELSAVEDAARNIGNQTRKLEDEIAVEQSRLAAYESALKYHEEVLAAGGVDKFKLNKKIDGIKKEISASRRKLSNQKRRLGRVKNPDLAQDAAAQIGAAKHRIGQLDNELAETQAAREALDSTELPVLQDAVTIAQVADAEAGVRKARDKIMSGTKEWETASTQAAWQRVDTTTQMSALHNSLDKLADIQKMADDIGEGTAREIRDNTGIILKSMEDAGLTAEAAAARDVLSGVAKYDMDAWKFRQSANQARSNMLNAMKDQSYQEYMTDFLEDGMRAINDKVAVPEWFDEAYRKIPRTQREWNVAAQTVIDGYDAFMNVWKGFATTSPGFMFRNLYGGLFGMYLDGVDMRNARRYWKFIRNYQDKGLEGAVDWARSAGRYSDREIAAMEESIRVASASGWGLNPQEIQSELVGSGATWKPWKTDFAPTRAVRGGSTHIEAYMRGAHAYDHLLKGADPETALRQVEKFHFNYRDISEFDQGAKKVIPFWTFYSRNMALQAEVWARFPHKLNRSYFNLKNNLELSSDPDQVVPGYYDELGAIRTPWGERDGGTTYLTPDLPSLRFRTDVASLTGTGGDGFDPVRLLSDASPAVKIPIEGLTDKRLFTDVPFKNRLYDYDENGDPVARRANPLLNGELPTGIIPGMDNTRIPGVSDAVAGASYGAMKLAGQGDKVDYVNGELLMTDKGEAMLEDIAPLLGRVSRLAPNNPKYEQRQTQSALSFLGAPVRKNTPEAIQGELYARQIMADEQNQRARVEALLQGLVP